MTDINIPPEALKAASTVIFEMREDGDFSSADIAHAVAEALLNGRGWLRITHGMPVMAASSSPCHRRTPMLKAEHIPTEVVEAAAKELAYTNGWRNQQGIDVCKPVARDILAAALSAWPGAQEKPYWEFRTGVRHAELILPMRKTVSKPTDPGPSSGSDS